VIAWDEWAAAAGLNGVGIPGDVNGDGIIDEEDTRPWKLPKPNSVPLTDIDLKRLPIPKPELWDWDLYGRRIYHMGGNTFIDEYGNPVEPRWNQWLKKFTWERPGTSRLSTDREWQLKEEARVNRIQNPFWAGIQRFNRELNYQVNRTAGNAERYPNDEKPLQRRCRNVGDTCTTALEILLPMKGAQRPRGGPACPKQKIIVTKASEPPQLARGKRAHKLEPVRPGEIPEYPTPSGKRMDRYNPEIGHIREIKPNNARQIRKGKKQVEGYRVEMEEVTGKPHTTEVTPYDPEEY